MLPQRTDVWLVFTQERWQLCSDAQSVSSILDDLQAPIEATSSVIDSEWLCQSLQRDWPELQANWPDKIHSLYVVLPDSDITHAEETITGLVGEPLYALAALSIASENSHLAPNALCYAYRVYQTDDLGQILAVQACPLAYWHAIESVLVEVRLAGVVARDAWQQQQHRATPLAMLKPYEADAWQWSQQKRLWRRFLVTSLMVQLLAASLWFFLQYQSQQAHQAKHALAGQMSELSLGLSPESAYQEVLEVIANLPIQVRLNQLHYSPRGVQLDMHVTAATLDSLLAKWQQRWPKWRLTQQVLSSEPRTLTLVQDQQQEVQHAQISLYAQP